MKKALTPTQGTAAVSEPWRAALRTFDQDLQRRGAAERTRRAYGTDAAELAGWATANGLNPQHVDYKVAAALGGADEPARRGPADAGAQAGLDPRPLPQPARARRGRLQPGRPAARAQAPADAARRRSSPTTSRGCWSDPGLDAARDARPRAVRARLLAAGCAPRSSSTSTSPSIQFDGEQVRVEGKGSKTRFVPGGRAGAALDRRLSGACPAGAAQRRRRPRAFPVQERKTFVYVGCPAPPAGVGAARFDADRRASARTPSFLRNAPARGRRGPARDPGDARSRQHLDDPGLHSGRVRPASGGVRKEPPAGVKKRPLWRPTSKRSS